MQLDGKRKFLIAFGSEEEQIEIQELIDKHVVQTQFFVASSTADANVKITNDPPHIVVSNLFGPKVDGIRLVNSMLRDQKLNNVPILLVGDIPQEKIFVDEIVLGRVQILDDTKDEAKTSRCLTRLLNFITRNESEEFHLKFLAPGDFLIRQGETAKYVYIVRQGRLEASFVKDDKRVILGPVDTGEFVGEMAFINGEPRTADVSAITDCELIEIPIGIMDKVLFHKPSWSRALMKTLSTRVKSANKRLT